MRARRFLGSLVLSTVAIALAPAAAGAFCRTRTVPPPADFNSANGCFDQGVPLYHPSQCVSYRLAAETPSLPRDSLSTALARAFGAWTSNNPTCLPGISVIELAPTTETKIVDYVVGTRGHNVVGVVEGPWPHAGGGDTLSLATLTFNAETGEVFDVDVELTSQVSFSLGEAPSPDGYDLTAVLTHEAGHFLGLAHSPIPEAVMWPSYTPGTTTQRTLATDDQLGVCAIYPNRTTRVRQSDSVLATACDLSPEGSPPPAPCGDPAITHGCAIAAAPVHGAASSRPWGWLAAIGALAAVAWRSRSRSRSRARSAARA